MIINNFYSVRNYSYINKNNNKPLSFSSNGRAYLTSDGLCMGCITCLFRSDLDWKKLAQYAIEHFSDKSRVNTIIFAASDGSESYSTLISLNEVLPNGEKEQIHKFLPIIGYDLDEEIVSAANSGFINTGIVDRMNLQMNCANYFDYFSETATNLEIRNNLIDHVKNPKTLKVKKFLRDNVLFRRANMFDIIKELQDDSNTILMCRNVLGYFENYEIENFIKLASQKLKPDSLLVIGDHEVKLTNICEILKKYDFVPVMKNVYKKT